MNGKEILESLLADGAIWLEGREYIGRASDGTEVALGSKDREDTIVQYLAIRPTPDDW